MAVSGNFSVISVVLTQSQQTVSVPHPFYSASDLKVYANGVLQVLGTAYTVTGGNGSTGAVVFLANGPGAGVVVLIDRVLPLTHDGQFTVGGPLPGPEVTKLFDRVVLLVQQVASQITRVLRFTVTTGAQPELSLTSPGVVGSLNGQTVAVLSGTQLAELINLQGSQVNRPTRTFTDSSARATAVPDFVGQLGIQLDQSGTESLYRSTGTVAGSWANIGTQVASSIAVGAVGTPQIAIGAVNEDRILDGSVKTAKIAGLAVDASRLALKTITVDQIADGTLTGALVNGKAFGTGQIATGAITSNELASDAVTTLKVLDGAISTAKLEPLAVTSSKLANGAVGPNQLANNSVEARHLSNVSLGIAKMSYLTTGTNVAYTPLANVRALLIECIGGGGGSGGAAACAAGQTSLSGGGGSGQYARKLHTIQANQTFKYTVGAGGAAGSSTSAGGSGNPTSFVGTIASVDTTLCRANGGGGGSNSGALNLSSTLVFERLGGGGGGDPFTPTSVGDLVVDGNNGSTGLVIGSNGNGLLSYGGLPPFVNGSKGQGGIGKRVSPGGVSENGSVGQSGMIIVTEFY